jgi:methylglutaconyl-CoA hydratase
VDAVIAELLSAGPDAARAAKQLARRALDAEDTARRIAAQRTSAEGQEGLRAFLEKRAPNWRG